MGTEGNILRLSSNIRSSIRSNVNINGYSQCVLELIYNSLDSYATSIAVRVDLNNHKIQVIDNGCGILPNDLKLIGKRYMTSKCKSLNDLKHNLSTFGYRGEALASIICMSESVNITSLHYKDIVTYRKTFYKTIENDVVKSVQRPTHGTTVTITNFMYNLGVRQKRVDPIFDMEEIRTAIETEALIHFYISFSLRDDNDGRLVLKTHKSKSIREAFFFLLDERVGDTLQPFEISDNNYKLDGYIARGTHSTKLLQYVYVNKRPVKNSDIQKSLNMYFLKESFFFREQNNKVLKLDDKERFENNQWLDFKSEINMKKFPVYIINLSCPYTLYDTTFLPDKSLVQFNKWEDIQKLIHKIVKEFVKKELGCPSEIDKKDQREKNDADKEGRKDVAKSSNEYEDELIKTALCKNAADFGPSQLQNAIKGVPAKRKRKQNEVSKESRKIKHLKKEISNTVPAFCTPKQNIKNKRILNKHVEHFCRNKNTKSNATSIHIKNINDKMRETPLLWSQLAEFKKPFVKHNIKKKCDRTKKVLNEFGIKSSILLKNQCHKTIHRSIYKNSTTGVMEKTEYTKSHTSISHSSIFHVEYKNGSLKNPFDKNKTVQEIEEWFDKHYVKECKSKSKSKIGIERTVQKSKCNYVIKSVNNNLEDNNDLGKSYQVTQCQNLKEYIVQIPRKFCNVSKDVAIPKHKFKCTGDMIKTVIVDPKISRPITDKDISNYKYLMKAPPTDWNEYYDQCISVLKHKDNKFSMKQYVLKDFGVQTDLCFKDLELMMYDLRNKYKEIENYESGKRRDRCKKNCTLRGDEILSTPNTNFKFSPICQSINVCQNRKKRLCEYSNVYNPSNSKEYLTTDSRNQMNIGENQAFKSYNKSVGIVAKKTNHSLNMFDFSHNSTLKFNSFNTNKNISVDIKSGNNNFGEDLHIDHVDKDTQSQSIVHESYVKQKSLALLEKELEIIPNSDLADKNRNDNELKIIKDADFIDIKCSLQSNTDIQDKKNDLRKKHYIITKNAAHDKFEDVCNIKTIQSKLQEKSSIQNVDEELVTSNFEAYQDRVFNDSSNNEIICTTRSMSILKTPISYPLGTVSDEIDLKNNVNCIICETMESNDSKSSPISKDLSVEIASNKITPNGVGEVVQISCVTPIKIKNNWTVKTDSFGKLFYVNNRTGMTVYENPNDQENTSYPYKVFKRPEFIPKGMSPILKLGESLVMDGINTCININSASRYSKENSSLDTLSKVKWAELYYTEILYNEFAAELSKNMDFTETGIINEDIKHMGVKNTSPFVFEKSLLKSVKVISQVDNKFIATIVGDGNGKSKFLTLFDQHAVHERIRLEYLLKEFQEGKKWKSISVQKPFTLDLQQSDIITLLQHKESFENLGLTFQMSKINESKIEITSIPSCFQYKELNEDDSLQQLVDQLISEEIDVFKVTRKNTSTIPAVMMKVISSKACHGAIKFGMKLTKDQCEEMMVCLAKCDVPFQCAHGRPVLTILADLKFDDLIYDKVHKLNLKNLKCK